MSDHTRVRRCAVLMIEPREQLELDVGALLSGSGALGARVVWLALAPHLDAEVEIEAAELALLGRFGETPWTELHALGDADATALAGLLAKGLLIGDGASHAQVRARDERIRASHWRPLSAVSHYFSRWRDDGTEEDARVTRHRTIDELVDEYGLPPPYLTERVAASERVALPRRRGSALDELFRRRATCRNFDLSTGLDRRTFADIVDRVLGCHAVVEVMTGVHGMKKSNPSGGCLHPLEPYLLVTRVDGVASGLYHYHAAEHALEPIRLMSADEANALARRFVAGQSFFGEAHAHVVLAARFERTFWKYRNHPKAYRAIVLEAGHVSQNLYLSATELGLGAYVTAAINEVDIEQAFGLDALEQSPLAVCGFGARAPTKQMMEFDPLGAIWGEPEPAAYTR